MINNTGYGILKNNGAGSLRFIRVGIYMNTLMNQVMYLFII